jgi:hypothetical protein
MCGNRRPEGDRTGEMASVPESRGAGTGAQFRTGPGKPRQDGTAGAFLLPKQSDGDREARPGRPLLPIRQAPSAAYRPGP